VTDENADVFDVPALVPNWRRRKPVSLPTKTQQSCFFVFLFVPLPGPAPTITTMSSSVAGSASVVSRKSTGSAAKRKSNRCCSWPVILIAVLLLAGAGILIWQFAPIGQAVNAVVPGMASLVPTPSPGSTPTSGSGSTFQFNQCTTTDDCCNGLDTICDLAVNEVLFAGTHNSYASQDEGFLFFLGNQLNKIEDQMEEGFRGINLDLCGCSNSLVMCHNTCSVSRSVNEVFTSMVSFLNNNPTEILLVTLELNPDMDQPVDLNNLYSEMEAVSGFVDYLYVHPDSTATWPTLRELKTSGKVSHWRS
jgi:hypothetical protein